MEQLANRFGHAGEMQPVVLVGLQVQVRTPAGGSVQAGTGEGHRAIPGVKLPGQSRVAPVNLAQHFGIDGPPQRGRQGSPAGCGEGEDGREEHEVKNSMI